MNLPWADKIGEPAIQDHCINSSNRRFIIEIANLTTFLRNYQGYTLSASARAVDNPGSTNFNLPEVSGGLFHIPPLVTPAPQANGLTEAGITGFFDGVFITTGGDNLVTGWACVPDSNATVRIKLIATATSDASDVREFWDTADRFGEPEIGQRCGGTSSNRRFSFYFSGQHVLEDVLFELQAIAIVPDGFSNAGQEIALPQGSTHIFIFIFLF